MEALRQHNIYGLLVFAIESGKSIDLGYRGTAPEQRRPVKPIGLVRNPDGDYLVAYDDREQRNKRYYLNRVMSVATI